MWGNYQGFCLTAWFCVISVGGDVVGWCLRPGEITFGVLSCLFAGRGNFNNCHRCTPSVTAMLPKKHMHCQRRGEVTIHKDNKERGSLLRILLPHILM